MLYTRLTDCGECADIQSLIDDIDCKLAKLAGNMYNNITLMLNQPINSEAIISLLNTINMIAAKVKLLIYKQ